MLELCSVLFGLGYALATPLAAPDHPEWLSFKDEHVKTYASLSEEHERFKIFMKNQEVIQAHNKEYKEGKHSWFMGINEFSDWTDEEMNRMKGGMPMGPEEEKARNKSLAEEPPQGYYTFPNSKDWRQEGAVTPVQSQGRCGSCWTFAAVAALEGRLKIKTGKLVKLSEQNLLDCVPGWDCGGGRTDACFNYVSKQRGIDYEYYYPYEWRMGRCRYRSSWKGGYDSGAKYVTPNSISALKAAIAQGPVTVFINCDSWHNYKGGIHYCSRWYRKNHLVAAVGYGWSGREGYWIIKNSWGKSFGENGYIRLGMNSCGELDEPIYPAV